MQVLILILFIKKHDSLDCLFDKINVDFHRNVISDDWNHLFPICYINRWFYCWRRRKLYNLHNSHPTPENKFQKMISPIFFRNLYNLLFENKKMSHLCNSFRESVTKLIKKATTRREPCASRCWRKERENEFLMFEIPRRSLGFTSRFSLRRERREADGVSFCYPAG